MKRRNFLRNSALFSLSGLIARNTFSQDEKRKEALIGPIGIQLYTVRDDMQKNPIETIRKIAGIGYKDVECAGYTERKFYGMSKKEFKKLLMDNGLTMKSGHTGTGQQNPAQKATMVNNWEAFCEDAAYMGQEYVVCAYLTEDERKTIDQYKKLAELFNSCGEVAKSFGLTFAFHNHDFEFVKIDKQVPFDIFLNETDAALVKFELDHFWIKKAGYNANYFFDRYPGRFPLWHVKDMSNDADKTFETVGKGSIDWKEVFNLRKASGMKYFYVEQDAVRKGTAMESIVNSYQYLNNLKV